MKELSIEEKAKRYDELLTSAKNTIEVNQTIPDIVDCVKSLFPELQESEDEKIRKELLAVINDLVLPDEQKSRFIAWLEKQGKSALEAAKEEKVDNQNCVKPTDKVEPQFKTGDWVIYNNDICQIVKRDEGCNKLITVFGIEKELVNERNLSTARLWTIQDAKDGDVLMSRAPFIYGRTIPYGGLDWYNGKFIKASNYVFKDSPVHPATKEQRGTLMKAMHEAGYVFDFDKKELKKIEHSLAWNEEDEKMFSNIVDCIKNLPIFYESININGEDKTTERFICNAINWFKSLKERYIWEPSDEQMEVLTWCLPLFVEPRSKAVLQSLINDLKKLMEE